MIFYLSAYWGPKKTAPLRPCINSHLSLLHKKHSYLSLSVLVPLWPNDPRLCAPCDNSQDPLSINSSVILLSVSGPLWLYKKNRASAPLREPYLKSMISIFPYFWGLKVKKLSGRSALVLTDLNS